MKTKKELYEMGKEISTIFCTLILVFVITDLEMFVFFSMIGLFISMMITVYNYKQYKKELENVQ